jgi:hypoxanthine phosphoribosyltransferase
MNVLLPADRIQARIREMAGQIARDYEGKPLVIVGVLNGCLMFLADLVRHLDHPLRIGFIQASSYRGETTKSGEFRFGAEILPDIAGCNILLLDDILDTGQTLSRLSAVFHKRGVSSLRIGVFVRKIGRQTIPVEPDYVGFEIPDKFVIGYGLDYNDEYRHLPFLAELPGG